MSKSRTEDGFLYSMAGDSHDSSEVTDFSMPLW